MNRQIASFLDRLAERFTALLAGVISSRVEGLHAVAQAEQQSQLEDLARKYEAEGKTAIAESLRERAARLTSPNLVGEAVKVIEAVSGDPLKLTGPHVAEGQLAALPDFSKPAKTRRTRRTAESEPSEPNGTGAVS